MLIRSFHAEVGGKRCVLGLLCLLTTLLFVFFNLTNVFSSSRLEVAVQSSHRQFQSSDNEPVMENMEKRRATAADPINIPSYVQKWYDELQAGSANLRSRRLFATFVVVFDRSQYDNNATLLSSTLNALAAEECVKQQSGDVDAGYQLYVIGPRDHMPLTTNEIEASIAGTLRSSSCKGDVSVSVRAVDGPLITALNNAAFDAYLDREAGYFRLALPCKLTKWEPTRPMLDLRVALDDRMSSSGHGMIVEVGNSTSGMTSVFFGVGHFEVFGFLLPPDAIDVLSGLRLLIAAYEEHNMTQIMSPPTTTTTKNVSDDSSFRGNLLFNLARSSPQFTNILETLNRYECES